MLTVQHPARCELRHPQVSQDGFGHDLAVEDKSPGLNQAGAVCLCIRKDGSTSSERMCVLMVKRLQRHQTDSQFKFPTSGMSTTSTPRRTASAWWQRNISQCSFLCDHGYCIPPGFGFILCTNIDTIKSVSLRMTTRCVLALTKFIASKNRKVVHGMGTHLFRKAQILSFTGCRGINAPA